MASSGQIGVELWRWTATSQTSVFIRVCKELITATQRTANNLLFMKWDTIICNNIHIP